MVVLQPVIPAELSQCWAAVKPGLQKSADFSKGQWITEDAYHAIKSGSASLYLWIVDGYYAGNILLIKKPGFQGNTLHIWSLFVETMYGNQIDENMSQIDDLASSHGCNRITFHSPRKGWDKRAERLGFSSASVPPTTKPRMLSMRFQSPVPTVARLMSSH